VSHSRKPHEPSHEASHVEIIESYRGSTLSDDLRRAAHALTQLGNRVKAAPYPYLGVAAVVGFVLGGGLWGRLGKLLITAGARAAFIAAARSALTAPAPGAHTAT
jgi:hypothetical protein